MSFWNIFQRQNSTQTQPPPYTETKANIRPPTIQADDVPQWDWTESQCQAWLRAVLMKYFELPLDHAFSYADRFQGAGPNIYLNTRERWSRIVGTDRAVALDAMIQLHSRKQGALPKGCYVSDGRLRMVRLLPDSEKGQKALNESNFHGRRSLNQHMLTFLRDTALTFSTTLSHYSIQVSICTVLSCFANVCMEVRWCMLFYFLTLISLAPQLQDNSSNQQCKTKNVYYESTNDGSKMFNLRNPEERKYTRCGRRRTWTEELGRWNRVIGTSGWRGRY